MFTMFLITTMVKFLHDNSHQTPTDGH